MEGTLVTACSIALSCGVLAGLRTTAAPLTVSWAAHLGWLDPGGTWLAFLDLAWSRWVLLAAALGELVVDQLPSTPSRTVPVQFGARIVSGGLSGAAVGLSAGSPAGGALCGIAGAVLGTLGGSRARARLAAAFGKDRPAAWIEDAVALVGALLILLALSSSGSAG